MLYICIQLCLVVWYTDSETALVLEITIKCHSSSSVMSSFVKAVYSDTTQLDVELSWVALAKCLATPTQLNSTQLNSTSSWVELRRYKRAFRSTGLSIRDGKSRLHLFSKKSSWSKVLHTYIHTYYIHKEYLYSAYYPTVRVSMHCGRWTNKSSVVVWKSQMTVQAVVDQVEGHSRLVDRQPKKNFCRSPNLLRVRGTTIVFGCR